MTAINTNVSALNAQYYLANTNKEMEQSMQRLSSGFKVNSAADDAAGLAIAGRMDAQTRGLTMAIKNANDAVSLAQTAEGALGEVTNMLQRIRELAVNSANSTLNDSDRLSLDNEVQALKAEIDRVGSTTTFNSQNLLDGSYKGKFQIGDKDGQTVDLKIGSAMTSALGMGGGSSGANTMVSSRVTGFSGGAVAAGDITINGQALGAFATTDDMEDIVANINKNVDNVTATAFNVVVAKNIGDGVTGGTASTGLSLVTRELGATVDTTFVISASSSMDELVSNINAETGGVIAASLNEDGKLVLSNNTGAKISVEDDSTASGSGFASHTTAQVYNGFLKLESDDDNPVRVETGNSGLAAPGTVADLKKLGFNQTYQQNTDDGYTVRGEALKSTTTHFTTREIVRGGSVDEQQSIVNIDAAALAAMANSTVTITDSAGNSISATFGSTAPADIDALVVNLTADSGTGWQTGNTNAAAHTAFDAVITAGTDALTLDYSHNDHDEINHSNATFSVTRTGSGVDTGMSKGDLTINGVEIFNDKIASDSFAGKLNLINSFTAQTGVTASASFSESFAIDPNKIIKGDEIIVNGTGVTVTASADVDALVTALNARKDATGLTATRSGNNITLAGENVQALTIEQKTASQLTDELVSVVNAVGASLDVARTITFHASDIHEGRTYTIANTTSGEADSPVFSVDVTAVAGETTSTFAAKVAEAIRGSNVAYRNGADADNITVNGSPGVISFSGSNGDAGLDMGLSTITFSVKSIGDTFGTQTGAPKTSYASLQLDSVANQPIKIDTGEVTTAANHAFLHGFIESNIGAADFDVNDPTLSAAGGTSMSGLSIASAAGASSALKTLDNAIDSVNAIRGNLGAIQNRLSYTTNNLSSIVTNTEGAKGRIMDADFAVETSKLAKTQILSQAATSMLAQANQSKQGILALLQ
jgi:flagellin